CTPATRRPGWWQPASPRTRRTRCTTSAPARGAAPKTWPRSWPSTPAPRSRSSSRKASPSPTRGPDSKPCSTRAAPAPRSATRPPTTSNAACATSRPGCGSIWSDDLPHLFELSALIGNNSTAGPGTAPSGAQESEGTSGGVGFEGQDRRMVAAQYGRDFPRGAVPDAKPDHLRRKTVQDAQIIEISILRNDRAALRTSVQP